jgi:hypothetical protein
VGLAVKFTTIALGIEMPLIWSTPMTPTLLKFGTLYLFNTIEINSSSDLAELPAQHIDTGMGLERLVSI